MKNTFHWFVSIIVVSLLSAINCSNQSREVNLEENEFSTVIDGIVQNFRKDVVHRNGTNYIFYFIKTKSDWNKVFSTVVKTNSAEKVRLKTLSNLTVLVFSSSTQPATQVLVAVSNSILNDTNKATVPYSISEFDETYQTELSNDRISIDSLKSTATNSSAVYVSIVIDDCGYLPPNRVSEWFKSGIPFTFAVIPFTPYDREFAELSYMNGFEVIVHAPMEALHTKGEKWEVKASDSIHAVKRKIELFISRLYPFATGMNNHMGSKATENVRVMKAVMKVLKANNFLFLDSLTTPRSVAYQTAKEEGLTAFKRDVFLDNSPDPEKIKRQLWKLAETAIKKGYAIGIGHIQTSTLLPEVKKWSKEAEQFNIKIVPISSLALEKNLQTAQLNN